MKTGNLLMTVHPFHTMASHHSQVQVIGPLLQTQEHNRIDPDLPTLLVDGGTQYRKLCTNYYSIGDNDSFTGSLNEKLPTAKTYTDFSAALKIIPKHIEQVGLWGLTGGRFDHEVAIIGDTIQFLDNRTVPIQVYWGEHRVIYSAGTWSIHLQGGFSLFVLSPALVKIHGACEYQLSTPTPLRALSGHGLSNIGRGEVEIECDVPFCILRYQA